MPRGALLALLVASAGCSAHHAALGVGDDAAACAEREFTLDGRLSDRVTDPPTVIRQRGHTGPNFRLVRALYAVDKSLIFARRFDELRPPGDTLEVFEGRLRPGAHELTVLLEYEGNGHGRLVDHPEYHVTVRASRSFVLGEGELGDVTVRARPPDEGTPARPPKIDFEFGYKAAR